MTGGGMGPATGVAVRMRESRPSELSGCWALPWGHSMTNCATKSPTLTSRPAMLAPGEEGGYAAYPPRCGSMGPGDWGVKENRVQVEVAVGAASEEQAEVRPRRPQVPDRCVPSAPLERTADPSPASGSLRLQGFFGHREDGGQEPGVSRLEREEGSFPVISGEAGRPGPVGSGVAGPEHKKPDATAPPTGPCSRPRRRMLRRCSGSPSPGSC